MEQLNRAYGEMDHQVMDWFIPENPNGKAMFWVHGGGWHGGSKEQWHGPARHFCDLGYTCVSVAYLKAPEGNLQQMMLDLQTAMAAFRSRSEELQFDSEQVCALGSSAGGHLVGMLSCISPSDPLYLMGPDGIDTRPNATVAYCPVMALNDSETWDGFRCSVCETLLGGSIEDCPERYREASPLCRIADIQSPYLFLHGDADETVSCRHSSEMHRLLIEANIPSRLILLAGVGHGFGYGVDSDAQKAALKHIELFLDRQFPA